MAADTEMQKLMIEAIDHYVDYMAPEGQRPDIEVMRKVVKYDDIKTKLQAAIEKAEGSG